MHTYRHTLEWLGWECLTMGSECQDTECLGTLLYSWHSTPYTDWLMDFLDLSINICIPLLYIFLPGKYVPSPDCVMWPSLSTQLVFTYTMIWFKYLASCVKLWRGFSWPALHLTWNTKSVSSVHAWEKNINTWQHYIPTKPQCLLLQPSSTIWESSVRVPMRGPSMFFTISIDSEEDKK